MALSASTMHLLINAFIILHLFLITVWLFPVNPQLFAVMNVFRRYTIFFGLDQDYSMFAPYPRKTNRHIFALITFHDQSTAIWSYPRMERLGLLESMFKERYRKYGNDNIVQPCFKMFLPDFARYIARLHACPENEPDLISIYTLEQNIPDPDWQMAQLEKTSSTEPILTNIFTYQVAAND